jgi:hypothetical protein
MLVSNYCMVNVTREGLAFTIDLIGLLARQIKRTGVFMTWDFNQRGEAIHLAQSSPLTTEPWLEDKLVI